MPELEFHQLDLRYQRLRIQRPRRQSRLLSSIASIGQQTAIVVVRAENRYVVIDGFQRVRALGKLGMDTIEAVIWDLPEPEALAQSHLMSAGVEETALEQGWLLWELHLRFSLCQEELARRFDRSVSWVSRRLALIRALPESVQERLRRGELPAHAAAKCLVPLARAKRSDCERLVSGIAGQDLRTRDIERLYRAWREGDPEQRDALLEAPLLYLRVSADAAGEKDAESLQRDFEELLVVCRRARATLDKGIASQWSPEMTDKLFRIFARLVRAIRQLENTFDKESADARLWPTSCDPGARPAGAADPRDRTNDEDLSQSGQAGDSLGNRHGPACGPSGESA